jgi:hypothetical protein
MVERWRAMAFKSRQPNEVAAARHDRATIGHRAQPQQA